MRAWKLGLVSALALSVLVSAPSSAAIKAGSICKKAGLTTIESGRKYTCVKQGKKFVWNKGVIVKAAPASVPTPVATPSATPTPSPSATPSPTPTFTPPARPTSLKDLVENRAGISYWAWASTSEKIKKATQPSIEVEVLFGPNTPEISHNTLRAVENVSKLYAGAISPKKVIAIYFSYEDRTWGQTTFAKYALRPSGNETKNMCQTPDTCWGAMAEIDYKGNGILLFSVNNPAKLDKDHTSGPLQAHEFAHNFQASQFLGTAKGINTYCCIKQYLPWWIVEGGATFVEAAAMNSDSFDGYAKWMRRSYDDFKNPQDGPFTKAWFEQFLQPTDPSLWSQQQYQWKIYSGGALVDEIFIALKGPDISMKLMRDVAMGSSWAEAFESNFGMSWSAAVPILAEVLTLQVTNP
ncbi:MAG: hypothetical protein ACKOPU_03915 [Candidatus Planktophila sp.]